MRKACSRDDSFPYEMTTQQATAYLNGILPEDA